MQVLLEKMSVPSFSAEQALNNIVKCWVVVALIGQWLFAAYILSVYAFPTLLGNTALTLSLSPGQGAKSESATDTLIFFAHILPAAIMAMSGLLQLIPNIRRNYPKFHKYNGRMFFIFGLSGAFTGLYLTWGAGFRFSDLGSLGVTLNGLLIPIAIYFAWKTIINKKLKSHQRFAIHSFILVNGVWSFRLYLMAWFVLNQGANGNSRNIDGPADIALSFASYLLPMLIAEIIFWAKRSESNKVKWSAASFAAIGTIITTIGVFAAGTMMWFPRVMKAFEGLF
ncbi:DUF2306 domain-containing protein [Litorilituus lipolyticus]|uniref:DUF2306 domain-containing protein n=1 Tax=Litorilituus lipolyticus TaxID=2491017 RepID=A0A502L0G8_9GAMM|nr:DUF2306 domain-containing protein [Litorilituus lipolyticus]TPH13967.1 DUF2306 domain-containing protein [Litorilituus lipolyticus]